MGVLARRSNPVVQATLQCIRIHGEMGGGWGWLTVESRTVHRKATGVVPHGEGWSQEGAGGGMGVGGGMEEGWSTRNRGDSAQCMRTCPNSGDV